MKHPDQKQTNKTLLIHWHYVWVPHFIMIQKFFCVCAYFAKLAQPEHLWIALVIGRQCCMCKTTFLSPSTNIRLCK